MLKLREAKDEYVSLQRACELWLERGWPGTGIWERNGRPLPGGEKGQAARHPLQSWEAVRLFFLLFIKP